MTTTSLGAIDMRSEALRLRGAARAWAAATRARASAQRAGAILNESFVMRGCNSDAKSLW